MYLDCGLTWQKQIFTKRKQLKCTANKSEIAILQRFQSKVSRAIVDPSYLHAIALASFKKLPIYLIQNIVSDVCKRVIVITGKCKG